MNQKAASAAFFVGASLSLARRLSAQSSRQWLGLCQGSLGEYFRSCPPARAARGPPPWLRFSTHPTPLVSSTGRRPRRRSKALLDRDGWVLCEVK